MEFTETSCNRRQRKAIVPYSGKLLREKTFRVFHSFRTIRESILRKILWPYLHYNWTVEIIESFIREILVLNRNAKVFSPKVFSYTVISTHTLRYSTYSSIYSCVACLLARHAFTLRADPGWPRLAWRCLPGRVWLGSTLALAVHTSVLTEPT